MTEEKAIRAFETMINIIKQDGEDVVTKIDIPLIEKAIEALNNQIKRRIEE